MPRNKSLLALLSVVGALAAAPAAASAATVANTNDSGPGSLRQAVIDAAPGETINLPAGTYTLTSGEIMIGKDLTIAGAGAGSTFIRGGDERTFITLGNSNRVTISGLTFRDTLSREGSIQGGVILNGQADLTLSSVVFTGNSVRAATPAPGIPAIQGGLVLSVGGNLTVLDSKFVGNSFDAIGASGQRGGVVQGGVISHLGMQGVLTMAGSSVTGNVIDARGGQGPAAASQEGGNTQGGMILATSESSTPSTIRTSTVAGNSVDVRGGPGGQDGFAQGGGVFLIGLAASFSETTIASNSVRAGTTGLAQGGGLNIFSEAGGDISVLGSTIAANSVEAEATSGLGGNLFSTDRVSFANTVVAGGAGSVGSENCAFEIGVLPTSKGFNLDSLNQCGFNAPSDLVNRDPQLGPLAENGGPTPTMLPAPTSPLVDRGAAFGLSADQRGALRPIDFPSIPNAPGGDGSDIGAVELQPSNAFAIGKLKKNRKKGTARLTVNLLAPAAGTLTLAGKGLKTRTVAVGASPTVTFVVATTGKVKKALRKKGRRKVAILVTYTPAGAAAATQTRKAKLVRNKPRPKGSKGKPSKARG